MSDALNQFTQDLNNPPDPNVDALAQSMGLTKKQEPQTVKMDPQVIQAAQQPPQQDPTAIVDQMGGDGRPVMQSSADVAKGAVKGVVDVVQKMWNASVDVSNGIDEWSAAHGLSGSDVVKDTSKVNWSEQLSGPQDSPAERISRGIVGYGAPVAAAVASGGGTLAALASGVGIDAVILDPHQERLSQMILDVAPELKNAPVIGNALQYLKNDSNESDLQGRFKNVLEGGLVGLGITAGFKGLAKVLSTSMELGSKAKGYIQDFLKPTKIGADATSISESAIPIANEAEVAAAESKIGSNAPNGEFYNNEPIKEHADGSKSFNVQSSQVSDYLTQFAQENPQGSFSTARDLGGVAPEEVQAFMNDKSKMDALMSWKAGDRPLTDLEVKVTHELLDSSYKDLAASAQQYLKTGSEEDLAAFSNKLDGFKHVENVRSGAGSAAGAALNAHKMSEEVAGMSLAEFAQKVGERGQRQIFADTLKNGGGAEPLAEMAKKLAALEQAGAPLSEASGAIVQKGIMQKMGDAAGTIAINGLISAPKTVMAPTLSRAFMTFNTMMTNMTAGAIGFAKGGEDALSWGQQSAYARGLIHATMERIAGTGRALMGLDADKITSTIKSIIKYEPDAQNGLSSAALGIDKTGPFKLLGFVMDKVGQTVELPTKMHAAAGDVFTDIVRRGKLSEIATAKAEAMGLNGAEHQQFVHDFLSGFSTYDKNLSDAKAIGLDRYDAATWARAQVGDKNLYAQYVEANDVATEFAKGTTFARELNPEGIGGKINGIINSADSYVPGATPLARVAMPMFRIGANITTSILEHSVGGLLLPEVRQALQAGGKQADVALAKMVNGSLFTGIGAALATEGVYTGPDLVNPRLRNALAENQGWQPDSIKVGDNYYSIRKMEPMASWLRLGSTLAYLRNSIKDPEEYQHLGAVAGATLAHFLSPETLVDNVSKFTEAYNEASKYGDDKGKVQSVLSEYASRFIPFSSLSRDLKNQVDPYKISLMQAQGVHSFTDQLISRYKSITPWLSESLPADRNMFGEPLITPPGLGSDFLSPFAESKGKTSDLVSRLRTLTKYYTDMSATNPDLISPNIGLPPKMLKIGGVGVALDPHQYEKFQMLAGGLDPKTEKPNGISLREALDEQVGNVWGMLQDEKKMTPQEYNHLMGTISKVVVQYRNQAKEQMMQDPEVLKTWTTKKQRIQELTDVTPNSNLGY